MAAHFIQTPDVQKEKPFKTEWMSTTTPILGSSLKIYFIWTKPRGFRFSNHIICACVWSVLLENSHKQNNGTAVYKSGNMQCRQNSVCFCVTPLHSKNRLVLQLSGTHSTRSRRFPIKRILHGKLLYVFFSIKSNISRQ